MKMEYGDLCEGEGRQILASIHVRNFFGSRWSIVILVKRAVGLVVKSSVWCDFALIVGPMYVSLITKMPWKMSFDNLKTSKMCF